MNAPPPGDRATKAVIAFSDGAVISYDAETGVLGAELPAGGKLQIAGEVEDHTGTMQAMRNVFNFHTHPGIGSPPAQKMT